MLVILVLILAAFASAPLFAQDQEQPNPPQQGGAARPQIRGPAPPVPGPPHDPHDLVGVWDGRRGHGGATFRGPAPELTEWGQQQLKLAKPSNNGAYNLKETNDPILTTCLPTGTPRIYLQPVPMQVVQTPKTVILLNEHDHTVRYVFTEPRHLCLTYPVKVSILIQQDIVVQSIFVRHGRTWNFFLLRFASVQRNAVM